MTTAAVPLFLSVMQAYSFTQSSTQEWTREQGPAEHVLIEVRLWCSLKGRIVVTILQGAWDAAFLKVSCHMLCHLDAYDLHLRTPLLVLEAVLLVLEACPAVGGRTSDHDVWWSAVTTSDQHDAMKQLYCETEQQEKAPQLRQLS